MVDTLTHSSFYGVLDNCRTEEDPFKNEGARVVISEKISHCMSMQIFMMLKGS